MALRAPRFAAALTLVLVPAALGQSFNIDLGTVGGAPAATYAGPGDQTGFWNSIGGGTTSFTLNDLAGNPTGVTIESSVFSRTDTHNPRPETAGDPGAAALLDDFFFLDGDIQTEIVVRGLRNGVYDLVIAAIHVGFPDKPTDVTWLSDDFSEFQDDRLGDGPYTGAWVQGVTHARFRVPVTSGELRFTANGVFNMTTESFGNLNAVQVIEVPAPGSAATLGAGLLALMRRRRGC